MQDINTPIQSKELASLRLPKQLDDAVVLFQRIFLNDNAFIVRPIEVSRTTDYRCCLLFIDGMVNTDLISNGLINSLFLSFQSNTQPHTLDFIQKQVLYSNEVTRSKNLSQIVDSMLYGDTVLLLDGSDEALLINTKGWKSRSISEPDEEKALIGPREGFTEAILSNTSLIRRRIKTSDLKFSYRTLGKRTNTKICVCYIQSLVDKRILKKLERRLNTIHIDGILDANYIVELIKDNPYSPFETLGTTERPDVVAGRLLEGRVAILVDGTPVVITAPYLFVENFQSDDDYYTNFYFASIGRILRLLSFWLTISFPAIYIALTAFHKEVLPPNLSISISAAREGVPFPILLECVLMLLIFEILREAGIRMPNSMGHALSIVGGLVIGQSAVEAKLISAPTVIIIAFAGITGLMLPRMKSAVILLRIAFALAAALFGFYGYCSSLIALCVYLISMRSVGLPYTAYLTDVIKPHQLKDTYIRSPWWNMRTRPELLSNNRIRLKLGKKS